MFSFLTKMEEICPLYISNREDEDIINMVLTEDKDKNQHYAYIENFSRLFAHLSMHNVRNFYCCRCLHRFSREDLLKGRIQRCKEHTSYKNKCPHINKIS